jgi:hypothetical protein
MIGRLETKDMGFYTVFRRGLATVGIPAQSDKQGAENLKLRMTCSGYDPSASEKPRIHSS